ncbi:MAG: hypothetical protein D6781_04160 [Verrucomicrobia bacterium]|nr:MAG: hypothetical protein D6781_04160 [Verrucomicrobiota bacterium]
MDGEKRIRSRLEGIHGDLAAYVLPNDFPGSILARRDKVGFATPLPEWIDASLRTEIRPLLMDPRSLDRGILDRGRLDRFLDSTTGCVRPDAAFDIFRWVSVELWFQTFIDAPRAAK